MKTLPDYLRKGLHIVSIGLNPSLYSVERGFYFARPQNRFWPAFNASGLVPEPFAPSKETIKKLFNEYHIGFTDVVKRPTQSGNELRAEDFQKYAPELRKKLLSYQPAIAWFHGKVAYRQYLRYAEKIKPQSIGWGKQALRIGNSKVFVTPNPSPANARFSIGELILWHKKLKYFRGTVCNV